ncbi:DEAD/DEAH box helicase family protein [Limnohabitans sp. DCL3]|uniref:restriction endonuclease n=1 Tax=Limnohabitans sp. DCL3 TaxID=3374103 RepID=UPI003A885968
MSHPAAFQLESLRYQTDAVEGVVRVFEGTPKPAADDLEGNHCPLTWAQIAANLHNVAQAHRINDDRLNLQVPPQGQPLDLCVEMETGTGKTLVYLRTIYRLHAAYGWNKFIVVVPTVAIRAGVMGSLTDFGAQLALQTGLNHPIPFFEYDSSRLDQVKTYIDSPTPAIMVMNSQAFVGEGKIISNEENEAPLDGLTWLQALARCRPIVVMDEPQMGMDTDAALKAFKDMKPLVKLRYSATHHKDHAHNCIYRLTPAQAYEHGLVKKIEVLTIDAQGGAGTVQLELTDTQVRAGQAPKAKLKLWHRAANGDIRQKISPWLSRGANLAEVTSNRSYVGWRIDHIEKSMETGQWQVRFDNGHTLLQGQALGQDQEGIFRLQLRWLIHRHFEKKARLAPLGIKCLSLVFIDKVANYLATEQGVTPLIKGLFEEEYSAKLQTLTGQVPDAQQVQAVQGSYFARTGQGVHTDSESAMLKNNAIYKRILTDKAGLLQLSDPVEFIFSHSALGVGWDNPNVFNIATLNATHKDDKKRQELGRGLRICVNQQGQRVYDTPGTPLGQEINLLTVVPNMSFEAFAQSYQEEIKEAYDGEIQAGARLRENRAGQPQKKTLRRRQDLFDSQAFQQFWQTMARTTHYSVSFDEDAIVQDVVPQLQKISVLTYSADITAVRIGILEDSESETPQITTDYMGGTQAVLKPRFAPQDWVQAIGQDSRLSQKAVLRLLQEALAEDHCAKQFVRSPVLFAQQASALIRRAERDHMLRGLRYTPTGEALPLDTLQVLVETIKDIAHTPRHGLYDAQAIDSGIEKKFAEAADGDPQLLCLLKLPEGYVIPTPVGHYTPDFGLVFKEQGHRAMELGANMAEQEGEFFVVEVKGTHDLADPKALTPEEVLKIECAARHFEALGFATTVSGRMVHVQPQRLFAAPRDTYDHFKKSDVNTVAMA